MTIRNHAEERGKIDFGANLPLSSRRVAPKPLVGLVASGKNSSESAHGHLRVIENSSKSALGQLG